MPVYATNIGRYQRVGSRVYVDILLDGDGGNEGAGTGQLNVALPIVASANQTTDYNVGGHFHNGALERLCYAQVNPSTQVAALFLQDSATSTTPATGADQNNTTRTIKLNFWYEVD